MGFPGGTVRGVNLSSATKGIQNPVLWNLAILAAISARPTKPSENPGLQPESDCILAVHISMLPPATTSIRCSCFFRASAPPSQW